MYHALKENRLVVEELPELDTEVAMSTTMKQQEVGGGFCIGVLAGIVLIL